MKVTSWYKSPELDRFLLWAPVGEATTVFRPRSRPTPPATPGCPPESNNQRKTQKNTNKQKQKEETPGTIQKNTEKHRKTKNIV